MSAHSTNLITSAHATFHCLTGCMIGEILGLLIGVGLAIGVAQTIALCFVLAFFFGFMLATIPIMRREGMTFRQAFQVVWLGEVVSITVMEIVMNLVDYLIGGIQSGSIFAPIFWIGMMVAIPAGFLAAWPVNHWLLKRQIKKCH